MSIRKKCNCEADEFANNHTFYYALPYGLGKFYCVERVILSLI